MHEVCIITLSAAACLQCTAFHVASSCCSLHLARHVTLHCKHKLPLMANKDQLLQRQLAKGLRLNTGLVYQNCIGFAFRGQKAMDVSAWRLDKVCQDKQQYIPQRSTHLWYSWSSVVRTSSRNSITLRTTRTVIFCTLQTVSWPKPYVNCKIRTIVALLRWAYGQVSSFTEGSERVILQQMSDADCFHACQRLPYICTLHAQARWQGGLEVTLCLQRLLINCTNNSISTVVLLEHFAIRFGVSSLSCQQCCVYVLSVALLGKGGILYYGV